MFKKFILVLSVLPGLAAVGVAQPPSDKNSGVYLTQEELAQRKRLAEILKNPTFITLRLQSAPRDVPREKSTATPAPYRLKDLIAFQLLVSQSLFDDVSVAVYRNRYYEVRPILVRNGDIASYHNRAKTAIERAEFTLPPGSQLKLLPGLEYPLQEIRLDDWYEPLTPGRYELTVRRRFNWQGEWLTSSPIYFEVQPRTPTPIPEGVSIDLVPEGSQPQKDGTYQAKSDVVVVISVVNNSDQSLKLNVIDREYGNQLKLFRDGVLIPYREEMTQRIRLKEETPHRVEIINDLFLEPKSRSWSQGISLKDWYGPLPPGSYRLTNRQRFEIDGPWTPESAPLLFEITASKRN